MELTGLLGSSRTDQESDEPSWLSEVFHLTWTQRLMGFAICFGLGTLFGVLSSLTVGSILVGRPAKFAFPYTLSNILSLGSTTFLMGPTKQVKSMFAKGRRVATTVYLLFLVITLVLAFNRAKPVLVLISIVIQMLALAWYSLSYIPFARDAVAACLKRTCAAFV